jgi:uncharacterized protein YdcH (DUF465 family)
MLDDRDEFEPAIENPHLRRLWEKYNQLLQDLEHQVAPTHCIENSHLRRLWEKYNNA